MVQLQKLSGETDETKRQWQIVNLFLPRAKSVSKSPKVGDQSNYARAGLLIADSPSTIFQRKESVFAGAILRAGLVSH